ncbi:hypothetical protein [Streptomyces sp. NPDC060366]|uniref:hypothetical protein n=1 Tax=Streptomyces sp. NPDC060366 TaxID=3347105 RepID=UPI003658A7AE
MLGTSAADAHDSVKATVTPSPVRPGGEVKIKVAGCENPRAGAARSDVFVADSELEARRGGDRKSPLQGEAKVKSSAKDGRYAVDVWCDGHEHRRAAVFEVDHNPKAKPKNSAKPSARTSASTSAKPKPKPKTSASGTASAKPKPKTEPKTSASAAASAKPKPKTSATATASTKPQAKPRSTSAKPSVKPSARPETKPESRPETKPESKPESRPETKPETRPESKPKTVQTGRHPQSSVPQSSQPRSSQAHADPGGRQASPVAPVRAGGGGRTVSTAAADEAGPSTPHTVIGLVLAGVAAVAVAIRSARRKRSAARDSD